MAQLTAAGVEAGADCLPNRIQGYSPVVLTIVRYLIAAVLVLAGLVWIGQGLGYIPGSFMSSQPIWAVIGSVLVVAGVGLAWSTRRRSMAR